MSQEDPKKTDRAIESFLEGNTEPLAKLVESNELATLFIRLRENKSFRDAIVKLLRGHSPRKRGRPQKKRVTARDRMLLDRICYWCGYGIPLWQVEAEDTACHRAVENVKAMQLREPALTPEAAYRQIWKNRDSLVGLFDEVGMASNYVKGMRAAALNADEISKRVEWAQRNGIRLEFAPEEEINHVFTKMEE